MGRPFIAVEGVLGVGKTTLAKALGAKYGYAVYNEPVETNPYLEVFYKDMKRWGAIMQLHLLHVRYLMHQRAVVAPTGVIQDRSLYGDTVFARNLHKRGLMSETEWQTYQVAWESMRQHVVYPDLIIFLHAPVEVYAARIASRDRQCEKAVDLDYLHDLDVWYDTLFEELQHCTRCVRHDWTDPATRIHELYRDIEQAQDSGFSWMRKRPTTVL